MFKANALWALLLHLLREVNGSDCTSNRIDAGIVEISLCPEASLCMIAKELDNGAKIFPIGRSFNYRKWETYPGNQRREYKFICDDLFCEIDLPGSQGEKYKYTECKHEIPVTRKNELARFLDQVTFGVTPSELESIDDGSPVDVAMAKWIETQMYSIKMTSHRAWYRKHANNHLNGLYETSPRYGFRPHDICEINTKWRKYAFDTNDKSKKVTFKHSNGKIQMLIDGTLRTFVDSIDWNSSSYRSEKGSLVTTDGKEFEICYLENGVGADFRLRDPSTRSCQRVDTNGAYGTPVIDLVSQPVGIVMLDDTVVQPVGEERFLENNPQELISIAELPECSDESVKYTSSLVYGFYEGQYYIHSPPAMLVDNTIENPMMTGGKRDTIMEGDLLCPTAPRTQFNERSCKISYEEDACTYESPYLLDFTYNHENIAAMNEATKNDPEAKGGRRYVFAIDGLVIDSNSGTASPCWVGSETRWAKLEDSSACLDSTVSALTESYMIELLSKSNDNNPFVKDIITFEERCHLKDRQSSVKGFAVEVDGHCWQHVHQRHLAVFDMTSWTARKASLVAASDNGDSIYDYNSGSSKEFKDIERKLSRLGRYGDVMTFADFSTSTLEIDSVRQALRKNLKSPSGVLVCGSEGESANDPSLGGSLYNGAFELEVRGSPTNSAPFTSARKTVMNMIALYEPDQLRQRVAWALSQIVTIASPSIANRDETEKRVAFTDIFVRHAFGSYRNILEEISFSYLMAENLSYMNSQSTAYHWEDSDGSKLIFPDENFAREIMQLYSVGLCLLNQDGSEIMDESGETCKLVYSNDDIIEYARVWTGFTQQKPRGNIEFSSPWGNSPIDPLRINPDWRDKLPKLGLNKRYIGDGKPLCVDRPRYHFLKKNAKYRLLGGISKTDLLSDPPQWYMNERAIRLVLETTSPLYREICQASDGNCIFNSIVQLQTDLDCHGDECDADTVRVVKVDDIYYEYVPEPCVEQAFFMNATKVVTKDYTELSCADPRRDVAVAACCITEEGPSAVRKEYFWGEKVTFETAMARCEADNSYLCDYPAIKDCREQYATKPECEHNPYYWSSAKCDFKVKIDNEGKVGVLYEANDFETPMAMGVSPEAPLFFPVLWEEGKFPSVENNCGDEPLCEVIDENCICIFSVEDDQVFVNKFPTKTEILDKLFIGAFEPSSFHGRRKLSEEVVIYSEKEITEETVFSVIDDFGVQHFLKNSASTVNIGSSYKFRNPPHFHSLLGNEPKDAYFETDAALDQLFYNSNTAPFLATNLIKRFGISNPSYSYIEKVATAFRLGVCTWVGSTGEEIVFGSNSYGDLGALIACLLLNPEARDVVLDLDSTHGSILEPLLKFLKLMRSMEAKANDDSYFVEFHSSDITERLGQEAYEIPSVFSYFLPDFQPSGVISDAALVSPEAQLLSSPYVIGQINGMFSLIKWGMKRCWGGLFLSNSDCYIAPNTYKSDAGRLTHEPQGDSTEEIIDDLSTLLTAGRLSNENKKIVQEFFDNEDDKEAAYLMAQQLIITTPEFHTSGSKVVKENLPRISFNAPSPSNEPYKAVVFLYLAGGFDSHSMLVPLCEPLRASYLELREELAMATNELLPIDVKADDGQICSEFGIHKKLPKLKEFYDSGKLSFLANVGASDNLYDNTNYKESVLKLFAHNTMEDAVKQLDYHSITSKTGVLGRLAGVLSESLGSLGNAFQVGVTAIQDFSTALVGKDTRTPSQSIVGNNGINAFDPRPWNKADWRNFGHVDLNPAIESLNNATNSESSFFGETWSSNFIKTIEENEFLGDILSQAGNKKFQGEHIGNSLEQVAKLIETSHARGVDRDFIFTRYGGWDHHATMKANIADKFELLNAALNSFWEDMKKIQKENQVTLIIASDFGRTFTPNSQDGSDHGWGGHYFIMGGDVKGGHVLGKYPDLGQDSPHLTKDNRKRFIPTTTWESVWYGVAEWMGIQTREEMLEVLPNAANDIDSGNVLGKGVLFKNNDITQPSRRSLRIKM